MLSPSKLAANNLASLCVLLDALRIIRQEGGFGSVEGAVKDGKLMYLNATIRHNVEEKDDRS